MTQRMLRRRVRAVLAFVLLLPLFTANAAMCALCAHRHSHSMHDGMTMDLGPMDSTDHHNCGPELSDRSCPGPQLLVVLATPGVVPEALLTYTSLLENGDFFRPTL